MKHPKNRSCEVCGKPSVHRICPFCQSNHAPIPEHHVAKVRACIRCRNGFESTWAGDRVCTACREVERKAESSGHWHESPLEPVYTPAAAELITG